MTTAEKTYHATLTKGNKKIELRLRVWARPTGSRGDIVAVFMTYSDDMRNYIMTRQDRRALSGIKDAPHFWLALRKKYARQMKEL